MTPEERFALRSLYFHARFGDNAAWPAAYRPMPVEAAAQTLAAARGPRAESRRRRAIARLVGSPSASLADPGHSFTVAIGILGAPADRLAADPGINAARRAPRGRAALRSCAIACLDEMQGPSMTECERTAPETTISFDRHSQLIVARSHLRARRPLDELSRVIDPQNWDRVAPQYFRGACIAAGLGPTWAPDADSNVPCDPEPPAPGTSWERVFFEHYALDIADTFNLVTFKNLLEIRTHAAATSHLVRYQLREVLYGKVGLLEQKGGGLNMDDGDTTLIDLDNGWVEISATKNFRLDGWTGPLGVDLDFLLNWWTSITIGETLDSVYEAVCLNV